MSSKFGEVLKRLRREAGFESAYSFYHKNGGRAIFGFNYSHYLYLEKGKSLPRHKILLLLGRILKLWAREQAMRDFILSYLESSLGPDVFHHFISPVIKALPSSRSLYPLGAAVKRDQELRTYNINQIQAYAIRASATNYWVFQIFSDDKGAQSAENLARTLDVSLKEIKKTLKEFSRVKLVKKTNKGHYCSPISGKVTVFPHPSPSSTHMPDYAKLKSYWYGKAKRKGGNVFYRPYLLRASESELTNYFPYLNQAVFGSGLYATHEAKPDSALFLVEGSVHKLFPF